MTMWRVAMGGMAMTFTLQNRVELVDAFLLGRFHHWMRRVEISFSEQ